MSVRTIVKTIAAGIKPDVYVELGCLNFTTTQLIVPHAKRVIAVDIKDRSEHLKPGIEYYCLSTDEFYADVKDELVIDLLFIDADHSYESVKRDFDNFSQLVRDQGIIVIHDTYPPTEKHLSPGQCSDSWKFARNLREWPEYLRNFETCTLPFNFGITIVRKTRCQLPMVEVDDN